jgi:glutaconate CoA-transferase subunit A
LDDHGDCGGAGRCRPSYAHGYYPRDNAFYTAWDAIARDRETFLAWMRAHVLAATAQVPSAWPSSQS